MRRFFRFSTRDLLWLTLVVAMGLGWFVRERQHNKAFLDWNAAQEAATWRAFEWQQAARALESVLDQDGWDVKLDFESAQASVSRTKPKKRNETYLIIPLYHFPDP